MEDERADQVVMVRFDYMRCWVGDFTKVAMFMLVLLRLYEAEELPVMAAKRLRLCGKCRTIANSSVGS